MNPLKYIRVGPKAGWVALNAAMALVLLAGVTTSGWLAMRWWDNANRAEVLDAAHDMLTKFLTVSPSTIDRDLVAVEEIAVGTFAEEWEKGSESVKEQVLAGGAERTPEIQSLAYVRDDLPEEDGDSEDESSQDAEAEGGEGGSGEGESGEGGDEGAEADLGTDENNAGPEIEGADNAVVLAAVNLTTKFSVPIDEEQVSKDELASIDTDGDGYKDPTENRLRMRVNLAKVDGEWKMSQVEVST